jgi:hypothetical protein
MTSERLAYLAGRNDASRGRITLQEAVAEQGMGSFRAMYFMGAADELTQQHSEWRGRGWEWGRWEGDRDGQENYTNRRKRMAKYDTNQIVGAIRVAAKVACEADPGRENDGGTCNFDAAYVSVPGMRKDQIDEIARLCEIKGFPGLRVWLNDHSFYGRILMLSCYNGQGNQRTVMAEAAKKSLTASGLNAGMYYQMD